MAQNIIEHRGFEFTRKQRKNKRKRTLALASAISISVLVTILSFASLQWAVVFATVLIIPFVFLMRVYKSNHHLDPINWPEQVIIVTGGSNGIGEKTVLKLIKLGAKVAILDINKPEYHINGTTVLFFQCDISNSKAVFNTVDQIVEKLGRPTVLFNNAAIVLAKPFLDCSVEELERVNNVSYMSSVYMTRAVLPHMVEEKAGHIISIASILAFVGVPQCISYCACKAAINVFFDGLRLELGQSSKTSNISFTTIYPAKVTTNMFSGVDMPQAVLPDVTPNDVATQVIRSIRAKKGGELFMPITSRLAIVLAFFPRFIRDWCYEIVGMHGSLDNFKGNKW